MSAYALKKSDIVLLSDGRYGIIEKSIGVQLSAPETTYNLEVEDFHTCFVGENPVCVHNANCGFGKYKDGMKMTEDESLDAATDFLGEGYKELLVKSGRILLFGTDRTKGAREMAAIKNAANSTPNTMRRRICL